MYVLSELPSDLDKQGSPMIPPPAWFGPGITWDLPVKTVKSSSLGYRRLGFLPAKKLSWVVGAAVLAGIAWLVTRPLPQKGLSATYAFPS